MLSVLLVPRPDLLFILGTRRIFKCKAARLDQIISKALILNILSQSLCLAQKPGLVSRNWPRQGIFQLLKVVPCSYAPVVRRACLAGFTATLESVLEEALVPRFSVHEQWNIRR